MRGPGAGGKANRIARLQSGEMTIEPDIRLAFDEIDELLIGAFRVRERCAPTRRQSLMVNAELGQTEISAERRADAHQLIVAVIVCVVGVLDLAPVGDEGRTLWRGHGVNPPAECTACF